MPHGHWKTTTLVAGLRLSGVAAPFVLDGPINRKVIQAYVDQIWAAIGRRVDAVTPDECANFFAAAGYDPD